MANFNPEHKAVLDDLLPGHRLVQPGKMFGFQAYYAGKKLCICLYEAGVGIKLPEQSTARLLQTDPHATPTWSYLYRHLIKQLQPEYRCIAMDHIGFGLSDKPTDWSYLPIDHAANLTALIDGLGLKDITLVVQDWGGPIGPACKKTMPA